MRHHGVPAGDRTWSALLLILWLALLTVPVASADDLEVQGTGNGPWLGVSVTDVNGWTLRGVTLVLAEDGRGLVIIRADGAEKALAFADVSRVVDGDGRDITDEVLTGEPAPAVEPEPAPAARAADSTANPEFDVVTPEPRLPTGHHQPRRAPSLFTFALDAGGGLADLTGDWFWGLEDGGFVQFGARLAHAELAYLHLLYRHQQAGTRSFATYGLQPGDVDFTMQSFQLMYGRHTAETKAGALSSLGYFEGGGGVMRLRADSGGEVASLTRFAFAFQAGLWLRVTDDLALDTALHAFYKPGWLDESEAGGTSLGLQLCIMYLGR